MASSSDLAGVVTISVASSADLAEAVSIGVTSSADLAGVVTVGVVSLADLAGDVAVGVASSADHAGVSVAFMEECGESNVLLSDYVSEYEDFSSSYIYTYDMIWLNKWKSE